MAEINKTLLNDFKQEYSAEESLLLKYKSVVPNSIISMWKEYGFGSFYEDFLKVINPDDYRELVEKSYFNGANAIPLLISYLGDVVVWEDNDHVTLIQYKNCKYSRIADSVEEFFSKLSDKAYDQLLDKKYFEEVMNADPIIEYDSCFIQRPMVILGGTKDPFRMFNIQIEKFLDICYRLIGVVGGERRSFGDSVPDEFKLYFGDRGVRKLSRDQFISEMNSQQWERKMYYGINIDKDGPSHAGYIYGCYYDESNKMWVVYQTGERGVVYGEISFDSEEEALGELKNRIEEEIRQHSM